MGRFIGLDLLETMIDGWQIRRKKIAGKTAGRRREKPGKKRIDRTGGEENEAGLWDGFG